MSMLEKIKSSLKKNGDQKQDKIANSTSKNWYSDRYESVLVQRNIFFIATILAAIGLIAATMVIRYVKSTKSIEPFVIEIEDKTGVPTVVNPVTVEAYSANQAIIRYFVVKYLKAREEYYPTLYRYNFDTVVRVLSSSSVYTNDYKPKFSLGNPQSPANLLGSSAYREVLLKSIIFPVPGSAQIRFRLQTNNNAGNTVSSLDKIVFMQYEFANIKMNEEERLINPLGFRVTNFRMENEL